jgi:hypothetical protein
MEGNGRGLVELLSWHSPGGSVKNYDELRSEEQVCHLLYGGISLGLFDSEDGGDMLLRNIG